MSFRFPLSSPCVSGTRADDHGVMEGHASDVRHQVYQTGRLLGQSEPRNAYIPGAAGHLICRGCKRLPIFITLWYQFLLFSDNNDDDACLTPIFQDSLGKPVPECLRSGFYWS